MTATEFFGYLLVAVLTSPIWLGLLAIVCVLVFGSMAAAYAVFAAVMAAIGQIFSRKS